MHASSSIEHQAIEDTVLAALNEKLGINLVPKRLALGESTSVQLDGLDEKRQAVCEVYARIGRLKGSQPDKVASDILKLCLFEQFRGSSWRKILCFACPEAAKMVQGKSWLSAAVKLFGVEVHVISLTESERMKLLEAQARQVMVNK
ncbi:MAG: hypothetical protein CL578_07010 [Alteromonadaceae bacterium]|uniref:hypothetical protein n=1 Tax=unclassified Methylophaga TaxID=2629249 RepID=UPI000C4B3B96|nr:MULTISPECIES: hypothetical protein [unclassified Methylophaga]MAP27015.1 hypothetical protein [Methylophaga sp.]MBN24781.1 hypothetical protein [Alteromonadaceae bacterium]